MFTLEEVRYSGKLYVSDETHFLVEDKPAIDGVMSGESGVGVAGEPRYSDWSIVSFEWNSAKEFRRHT
jgi:hypothetical protein